MFHSHIDHSFLSSVLQTATLFWEMPRCSRSIPLSTAPMVSVSSPVMPVPSSCRRAAPVTSCTARKQVTGSRHRSKEPWMRGRSSRPSWFSTRRKVRLHEKSTCVCLSTFNLALNLNVQVSLSGVQCFVCVS